MKRLILSALAAAALATGLSAAPAAAAPSSSPSVAPITCSPEEDTCLLDFVGNDGNGYWIARRQDGGPWVRLTLVPGWSTAVAPITCKYEDSCLIDFVGLSSSPLGAYWRAAQQSNGVQTSGWVRLTL